MYGILDERRQGGDQTGISVLDNQKLTRLRQPNEYFRIDDNLFYIGEVLKDIIFMKFFNSVLIIFFIFLAI